MASLSEQHGTTANTGAKTGYPASDQGSSASGFLTTYRVARMDCAAEQQLVQIALSGIEPAVRLEFDLPARLVKIYHRQPQPVIDQRLQSLALGASWQSTEPAVAGALQAALSTPAIDQQQATVLRWLLTINGAMFGIELIVGWLAQSTGLIADSLDMFADAAVYTVALVAVGRGQATQLRAAHFSGWLQAGLAVGVLVEVARRFWFGSEPVSTLMICFGLAALAANTVCLWLIGRDQSGGAHMQASLIFSANDVIANLGVILAGLLVAWSGSRYPDLLIGLVIGAIVLYGARRILRLRF